jgi:hypothetical protein
MNNLALIESIVKDPLELERTPEAVAVSGINRKGAGSNTPRLAVFSEVLGLPPARDFIPPVRNQGGEATPPSSSIFPWRNCYKDSIGLTFLDMNLGKKLPAVAK